MDSIRGFAYGLIDGAWNAWTRSSANVPQIEGIPVETCTPQMEPPCTPVDQATVPLRRNPKRKNSAPQQGYKRARDGLISHRRVDAVQQAVFERNARESPLLRLPTEARERIYELALGGWHIHIESWFHYQSLIEGIVYSDEEDDPDVYQSFCTPNSDRQNVYGRFSWAYFEWPDRYKLGPHDSNLAGVCRQLHQETALSIFKFNLFSFDEHAVMLRWLKTLKPVQARAIRQLCFPKASLRLMQVRQKALGGLREIYLQDTLFETSLRPACMHDCERCEPVKKLPIKEVIDFWKGQNVRPVFVHDCNTEGKSCKDITYEGCQLLPLSPNDHFDWEWDS